MVACSYRDDEILTMTRHLRVGRKLYKAVPATFAEINASAYLSLQMGFDGPDG